MGNEESVREEAVSVSMQRRKSAPTTAEVNVLDRSGYITKYHRLSDLNNRNVFLTVLDAGSLRSGRQLDQILVRALLLACR